MFKILGFIFLIFCLFSINASATIIISDEFDNLDDWNVDSGSFLANGELSATATIATTHHNISSDGANTTSFESTLNYKATSAPSATFGYLVYNENANVYSGTRQSVMLRVESAQWRLFQYETGSTIASLNNYSTVTDGNNHEIKINYTAPNNWEVFLDGISEGSGSYTPITDNNGVSFSFESTQHVLDNLTFTTSTVDGTDGVQALVDAASDGDIITLENKQYEFANDYVQINSLVNLTIQGGGIGTTIINTSTPDPDDINLKQRGLFNISGSTNITIKDMTIQSEDSWIRNTGHDGIQIDYSDDCNFENLNIKMLNVGIDMKDNCNDTTITNVITDANGAGIGMSGINVNNYRVMIENSITNNSYRWHGVDFNSGTKDSIVTNCTSYDNANAGFKFYSASVNNTLIDSISFGNQYGVEQNGGDNLTLLRNILHDNDNEGIRVIGSYTTDDGNLFKNNLIYSNGGNGIGFMIDDANQYQVIGLYNVTGNTIVGNMEYGIENSQWNFTVHAKNNIIVNNGLYGMWDNTTGTGILTTSYNDVWNNTGGNYNGLSAGTGDISENPLFYNLINHLYYLNSTAGTWNSTGFEIMSTDSPCIDAGDPLSDYSLEPSPNGDLINMGADGNTPLASKTSLSPPSPDEPTSPWDDDGAVDLWVKLGGIIVLGAVVFIVGIVIAATKFDRPIKMDELVAIGLGALILVVLFGVIAMIGSTMSGL